MSKARMRIKKSKSGKASGDSSDFVDKFISVAGQQVYRKVDKIQIDLHANSCHTEDTYTANASAEKQHRISWLLPEKTQDKVDGIIKVDSRGQLTVLTGVTIKMKNLTEDTIKVRGSCPKSPLDRPGIIGTRQNVLCHDLSKGATRTIKIRNLGDKNNMFGPLLGKIVIDKDNSKRSVALYDYAVILPDVSVITSSPYNVDRKILALTVHVRYSAIADQTNVDPTTTLAIKTYQPIAMQNLPNLESLYHVDVTQVYTNALSRRLRSPPMWAFFEKTGYNYVRLAWDPDLNLPGRPGYGIKLVHCDAQGNKQGNVSLTSFEDADVRICMPSVGYSHPVSGATATHGSVSGIFAYDRTRNGWYLWDQDTNFWTGRPGREDDFIVVNAETPVLIWYVNQPSDSIGAGAFRNYSDKGAKGWVDKAIMLCNVITEVLSVAAAVGL